MTYSQKLSVRDLKIGVIGAGKMGLQHVRTISGLEGVSIVGVADPGADAARVEAALPQGTRFLNDPGQLLELKPDIIHIVTPPSTHAELSMRALRAGCHIYVEKPFAESAEEARVVLAAAAERNLQVCAGHQLLFERPMRRLQELFPLIGRPVHVESYVAFRMVRRNITAVEQSKDILPHAVYLLLSVLARASGGADVDVRAVEGHASGDVHARVAAGNITGTVALTLAGRPVQQFLRVVGTNGSLHADFVTGATIGSIGPGASAVSVLINPYSTALQSVIGATAGFWRRLRHARSSYPGLREILEDFYLGVRNGETAAMNPTDILNTVSVCERIGHALDSAYRSVESRAAVRLQSEAVRLAEVDAARGLTLVTGGSGFLGKRVAAEIRATRSAVRVLSRGNVPFQSRLAGVEYVRADLARPLDPALLSGVTGIVHCAAETAGGQAEHELNSITATRNLLEGAIAAGINRIVHVSSVAVLASTGQMLDERSRVDAGNPERGPYVWGKAESEVLARQAGGDRVKILRLAPLVDFDAFEAPGRLGRELSRLYVAVGPKNSPLPVCDVGTAARIARWYVQNFAAAPAIVNLVEPNPPTRLDLIERLISRRPELRVIWVPAVLVRAASAIGKVLQRIVFPRRRPLDVYAAFASERYRTDVATQVSQAAGPSAILTPATATSAPTPDSTFQDPAAIHA
jgi:predicted dehydrogenase/nucleoside-diphosphate-sugar epimerase